MVVVPIGDEVATTMALMKTYRSVSGFSPPPKLFKRDCETNN